MVGVLRSTIASSCSPPPHNTIPGVEQLQLDVFVALFVKVTHGIAAAYGSAKEASDGQASNIGIVVQVGHQQLGRPFFFDPFFPSLMPPQNCL